jgi:predicted nucleic acid-binding Zn ribbon protein
MPIGFDRGDGRRFVRPVAVPPRGLPPDRGASRSSWAASVQALGQQTADVVLRRAEHLRVAIPTLWTRWETSGDDRVCPICGPYAGRVWRADEGPQPPLHPNCRCQRVDAFVTWQLRER